MKITLVAITAVLLGAAATASASIMGVTILGNGDGARLAGTHIGCGVDNFGGGSVMACQKSGDPLTVWIDSTAVWVTKGAITSKANLKVLAACNWQGGESTATTPPTPCAATPTPTTSSPSATAQPAPKASCNSGIVDARESFAAVRIGIALGVVKIDESLEPASVGQPLTLGEVASVKSALSLLNNLVGELDTSGSIVKGFNSDASACATWAQP